MGFRCFHRLADMGLRGSALRPLRVASTLSRLPKGFHQRVILHLTATLSMLLCSTRYQSVSSKAESLNGTCETLLAEQVRVPEPSNTTPHLRRSLFLQIRDALSHRASVLADDSGHARCREGWWGRLTHPFFRAPPLTQRNLEERKQLLAGPMDFFDELERLGPLLGLQVRPTVHTSNLEKALMKPEHHWGAAVESPVRPIFPCLPLGMVACPLHTEPFPPLTHFSPPSAGVSQQRRPGPALHRPVFVLVVIRIRRCRRGCPEEQ